MPTAAAKVKGSLKICLYSFIDIEKIRLKKRFTFYSPFEALLEKRLQE
jgi:hypothetical protein